MFVRACGSLVDFEVWQPEIFWNRRLMNDIREKGIVVEGTKEGIRPILGSLNVRKRRVSLNQEKRKGWEEESRLW
ncbi:hypothetical protein AXF42_Ash019902 [Apostasia shenzhenica]|uniref:Uncharacterized protein n=1 Tax=Apostasia shenzhenica TaxID=1088818 RepID=A0A2H9ZYU9_9ASPA|nr:hypothetical protein AXF42_Ash019902 [Apostasia shenzhenica]